MLDEIAGRVCEKRPERNQCEINLSGVTVKWPASDEQEEDTLKDISFRVKPGQVLAIVGHVGSGKVSHFLVLIDIDIID